jgi:hypothetical protein
VVGLAAVRGQYDDVVGLLRADARGGAPAAIFNLFESAESISVARGLSVRMF